MIIEFRSELAKHKFLRTLDLSDAPDSFRVQPSDTKYENIVIDINNELYQVKDWQQYFIKIYEVK